MEKYSIGELLEQPIVIELYPLNSRDSINVLLTGDEREEVMSMSVQNAVDYVLANYEQNVQNNRICDAINRGISRADTDLVYYIHDQFVRQLEYDNPINNKKYLRVTPDAKGQKSLVAPIRLLIPNDFSQG